MKTASNLLAFAALAATLLLVWRQSWPGRVRLFVVQSVALGVLAVAIGALAARPGLLPVAAVFLAIKTWIVPRVLGRIAAGTPVRPVAPRRSSGVSVLVAGAFVVVAYAVMLPVTGAGGTLPTLGAIPLAFAIVLIGFHMCVTGRDALGQILGFLVLENGIFGLALLATYGLPGLLEAGVFLEALVIVLLMEGVVVQIRRAHDSLAVDRLRDLRG